MTLNIPTKITPGDTLVWFDVSFDGIDPSSGLTVKFSPTEYLLTYSIRGAVTVDLVAVEQDGSWKTTLTSVASSELTAGSYYWQAHLTNNVGDRTTVGQGQLLVGANLAAVATAYDGRSEAKKMLDAVTAAISARLTGGAVLKYAIKDRDLERDPLDSLYVLRDKLKWEVAREEKAGKSSMNFIRFR
ncbi:hypothetical protein [Anabaena catenula]|uniref:Uncharacterized protein n=1 Tax=Anabaena catenula FACHB-362 TaxID=2692877 RepID=A0ABR8J7V1_9NOST|nr:hypothetical protein [Anabaena catenula]MBD2694449.1 hypothetical protein [Anabaena catenula FACHB-362]